jgi:CheY-like chemotaxis protein
LAEATASKRPRHLIRLIHWDEEKSRLVMKRLRDLGFRVELFRPEGMEDIRALADRLPAAVVIDLSSHPSRGRDMALAIRQRKATRRVPLLFVEGDRDKVARIRQILPDAHCASWAGIGESLRRAIESPPENPRTPSLLDGYSGTPLPRKLGIKPGSIVLLLSAPRGFRKILGELPEGVRLVKTPGEGVNLVLWFLRSREDLAQGIGSVAARLERGSAWMIWPKKSSGVVTDLTQQDVRGAGLAAGLVDYKICSVDATWSGLLFTRRR